VGGGDDVPRLRQLADSLGLQSIVIFTGEIADAELVSLYRRSDVFLLPARTVIDKDQPKGEGFGIVYLEAMAFEKPVIGPDRGAPVEVIERGKTGLLVDPDDPEALVQALVHVLTHPEEAQEMGRAGRKRVMQYFSYETFRERLRELITNPAAKGVLSRSPDAHFESDTSVLPL
jgi:glycosyltransferase involved in cell wall biosynthesis